MDFKEREEKMDRFYDLGEIGGVLLSDPVMEKEVDRIRGVVETPLLQALGDPKNGYKVNTLAAIFALTNFITLLYNMTEMKVQDKEKCKKIQNIIIGMTERTIDILKSKSDGQ